MSDAASPPVFELDGARATIRLNRPRHLNRLQPDDLDTLMKLFRPHRRPIRRSG